MSGNRKEERVDMDTETEELPFEDALARLEEKVELLEKEFAFGGC